MNYIVSEFQIDSLLKRYFDKVFSNSSYLKYVDGKTTHWNGFFKKGSENIDDMIVGYTEEFPGIWFTNGSYFSSKWDAFNVDMKDFNESMKRYLNKYYDAKIDNLM